MFKEEMKQKESKGSGDLGHQQQSDREAERRKKIEQDVQRRQECEKRAFRIVEKMLDGPVSEATLLQDAFNICPNHFDDIVEERAIAKMCGYPICPNTLGHIPKQKYHISTRSNKVYDITARKNFCSNQCFTASQYFRRQLLTAPLWAREHVTNKPIKLLPLGVTQGATSGLEGDEVISVTSEIRHEVQSLKRLEKYESKGKGKPANKSSHDPDLIDIKSLRIGDDDVSSKQGTESSARSAQKEKIAVDYTVTDEKEFKDKKSDAVEKDIHPRSVDEGKSGNHGDTMSAESKMKYLETLLNKRKHLLVKMADFQSTKLAPDSGDDDSVSGKDCLGITKTAPGKKCDNVTSASDSDDDNDDKTEIHESVKTNSVLKKSSVSPTDKSYSASSSAGQAQKLSDRTSKGPSKSVIKILCQTLKQWVTRETIDLIVPQESEAPDDGMDQTEFQLKYNQLCQRIDDRENDLDDIVGESKMEDPSFPQKPVPDYNLLREETENFGEKVAQYLQGKTSTSVVVKEVVKDEQSEINLPTVDSHDQMLIRKKIVMEKLNRSIPELLVPLKLSMQEVFSEVRLLVSTFSFTSQNIIFRPAEWTLVCLILIKILARRHHHIAEAFKEESAVRHFDILLRHLGDSQSTVDQYISQIILTPLL
ncbi:putative RNA polymerase II subunit B1 CTD phosphatase RPAP2 isoform X2 [Ylistrum balloti]|uniref:putative RNA polymerase II subunit B1 CTD phosphatase RPAP2 isoform X2 n=1 Tax=Ylistrum balloti TaxID=509963 RepID=UPI002905BC01|nr:putative RNA polymerase II subunit B1 CTD phosphatase RPAP2 isoform X2 [Ylistrum balloti]